MDAFNEELPLSEEEINTRDKGASVPPGWYVVDIENVSHDDSEYPNLVFHLRVVAPERHAGAQVNERLWNPKNSADDKRARTALERRGLFAKRLGLMARGQDAAHTRVNWREAVGKRVVVSLAFGPPNARGKSYLQAGWADIYPLDHERLPDEAQLLLSGGVLAAAAERKRQPPPEDVEYGDI